MRNTLKYSKTKWMSNLGMLMTRKIWENFKSVKNVIFLQFYGFNWF